MTYEPGACVSETGSSKQNTQHTEHGLVVSSHPCANEGRGLRTATTEGFHGFDTKTSPKMAARGGDMEGGSGGGSA